MKVFKSFKFGCASQVSNLVTFKDVQVAECFGMYLGR
jgi:hypothetical protein